MFRRVVSHLPAAAGFVLLAVALTWPIARQLSTHLPGVAVDDNMVSFWNFWWMRQSLADGLRDFFHTPFQFYPAGIDLVLYTHTATNAFIGATLFGRLPIFTAMNLTILMTCTLNGYMTYLLAYRVTADRLAAAIAGMFFAASPCLTAHLYGHFNYYTAWTLPLFVLTILNALDYRSWAWAIAGGVALAVVAYADYYYAIYAAVLLGVVLGSRWFQIDVRRTAPRAPQTLVDVVLLVFGITAAAVATYVAMTGGGVFHVGGVKLSLTTGLNVRALASVLLLIWALRRWRPRVSIARTTQPVGKDIAFGAVTVVSCLALLTPVLVAAMHLWRGGHYVSQIYGWRSAPEGIDVGNVLFGNPFNSIWGGVVRRLYQAIHMDPFVGPLWLGLVPSVLLLLMWRTWATRSESRVWKAIGVVFLIWALGPHLTAFGVNTALPLPQLLLRYVPIVSNARIPNHAVILVYLAAAVLLAITLANARFRRSAAWMSAIALLVLVDFLSAPVPTVTLDRPAVYEALAALPDGGLLEIPFGIRDGFGEHGSFDPRSLYYQSIHRKPIVGGYTSRLSPAILADYTGSPVLGPLMQLSARNEPIDLPTDAGEQATAFLKSRGIRYVVVNTEKANPAVREYVGRMDLKFVTSDKTHQLFVVK